MKQTLRTPTFFGSTLTLEVGMSARLRPHCPMLGLFRCRWSAPAPNDQAAPAARSRLISPSAGVCPRCARTLLIAAPNDGVLHELPPSVVNFLEMCSVQPSLLAVAAVGEENYRCRLAVCPACGHASTDPLSRPYQGMNGSRFHKVRTS